MMVDVSRTLVVSVLAGNGTLGAFGLGSASEVFGYDYTRFGLPTFDYALVAEVPGPVRTDTGLTVLVEHGLDRLAVSDVVVVTARHDPDSACPPAVLAALRAVHARGGQLISHCSGAFVLAEAGLLDGRRAATHWRVADDLAARFPAVDVDPRVLYVDEGSIITGAGTAAGVDALLHWVRREYGPGAANALAREMVVPPHRDGGQAQYVDTPVARCEDDLLGDVLGWAQEHLAEDLTVEVLARRALMSPRSFARRFKDTTGTTPHAWLLARRLAAAETLLADSDAPVEEVARLAGFGTAAGLREHFARRRGISPRAYRQAFRTRLGSGGAAAVQLDGHRAGAGGVRGHQAEVEAGMGQPA
jgi:transcriptional regulator GlxA family with amidase domain